ncbi:hypothetical protein LC653_29160 [Nostoc sp. CHAB 5784]|nr:hypothetical protein [Nostoc mirabile]MCC5667838.1 hypothetical protein [Nostoc mirabile CHAB5784]
MTCNENGFFHYKQMQTLVARIALPTLLMMAKQIQRLPQPRSPFIH